MTFREELLEKFYQKQDKKYAKFQAKLIPTIDSASIIGVRTPELRKIAKEFAKRDDVEEFLLDLSHQFFEENQVHAFILSNIKDYEKCLKEIEAFLPYVDNWATCDQLTPKSFKKNKTECLEYIKTWLNSKETYTIRFGIKMLMTHFLDEAFHEDYPIMVSEVYQGEYYVKMMIAWYFAEGLVKRYEEFLPLIQEGILEKWTHNKAIQKAVESRRVSEETKAYLKTFKK